MVEFEEIADGEAEMKKWFPGLYRKGIGTKCDGKPNLRIICFPPAGCAEDLFTTEGTGARREESPLLEWARSNSAEVLGVQYPGRANRRGEEFRTSIREIVDPLHKVLADCLGDGVPYVIVAHSVGTWVAYELLQLVRGGGARKMKMPEQVILSAFPPPTIPSEERPWRVNEDLSEEEFVDECRRWNINEVVFTDVWTVYHPMLRADFTLFDRYEFAHDEEQKKFSWPLTVFYGKHDGMITEEMCRGWKDQTSGLFRAVEIDGHHLFPLEKGQKKVWLDHIAKELEGVLEVIELRAIYG